VLTSRRYGGRPVTSRPASSIRPWSGRSKPAISRRVSSCRARGPEQGEELAARDLEVDAVDRDDIAVSLADADQSNVGHVHADRGTAAACS